MFIVWGRKIVRRKLGHVADFCPVCRSAKPFRLIRVGSAGHVYYISAGEGELLGFERTCSTCHTTLQADPATYADVSNARLELPALIAQTYPRLQEVRQERLAIEARIRDDLASFTAEDRAALIREPFLVLSSKVEQRFSSTHIDTEMALAIVAALALLIVGPICLHGLFPNEEGALFLTFAMIGLALVVWQGIQSGGRFMRRQVLPQLANALRPLKPTEAELATVISELRVHGHKMGRRLNAQDLFARLDSQPLQPAGFAPAGSGAA